MKVYEKKSLYLWILFFTGVASILLNAFVFSDIKNSIAIWLMLSILTITIFDEKSIQNIINKFKSNEFSEIFDYYYKCFLLVLGLTMFLTMTITLFYYSSSSKTPVSTISYIIFIAFSLFIYLNKKFNFFKIAICESTKKVEKK